MATFGVRTTLSQRRKLIASWTAMGVFAAGLTAYAITQDGYPVHHAALNDGGIWVTNPQQADGGLGRENRPIQQLDTIVPACAATSCGDLDVLQQGSAVFSLTNGVLTPVVPATSALDESGAATVGKAQIALGGATVASLDSAGALRAAQVDPDAAASNVSALDASTKPLAKTGAGSLLAVGPDGTSYVGQGGTLTRVGVIGTAFAKPTTSALSPIVDAGGSKLGAAVVGDTFVYPAGATQVAANGKTTTVPSGSVLQQAGEQASSVLIGTSAGLSAMDLGSGSLTTVLTATGAPSRAVRLNGCTFMAWAGQTSTVGTVCDGGKPSYGTLVGSRGANCSSSDTDSPLVLRVNRGEVLVNDVCTGNVWPFGTGKIQSIANWQNTQPKITNVDKNSKDTLHQQHPKPKAKPDTLGVRSGAEAVLHVLDNDSAAQGSLLAISNVSLAGLPRTVHVNISPDRQTILATADGGTPASTTSFTYTIDDGTGPGGPASTATVTLNIKGAGDSAAHDSPAPRGRTPDVPTYNVAAGGTVNMPVADGWRDRTYGDPVTLVSTSTPGAQISPEGLLSYTAPTNAPGGTVTVNYKAAAGGPTVDGQAHVNVVTDKAVAPNPQPDVASGVIIGGRPASITISPLANDLPGADPADPAARLTLAGANPAGGGAPTPVVDKSAGTIQITASRPGNFTYKYSAGFGGSSTATASIRVMVSAGSSAAPVAVPDSATIYGTQPKTVDVLANDFDPLGRVLVLQSAAPTDDDGSLQVGVVDNHWIRVINNNPNASGSRQITYSIAAGDGATATGTLTVTISAPQDRENTPLPVDDTAVVRAGDSLTVPVLDNDTIPSGAPVGLLVSNHGFGGATCPAKPCGLPLQSNSTGDLGEATYAASQVRYVAPANLTGPITVQIPYTAYNQSAPKFTATGTLIVQVIPKPTTPKDDQPPTPRPLDARLIQGDTIQIKIPGSGMDPDGDAVSLTGIGDPTASDLADTVPHLGQVLAYGGNSITYQAFPTASGTDTFSYVVTDIYGKSAAGTVRVGVAPSDAAQQPVPVDDIITADPNKALAINVIANDIKQPGSPVALAPLQGAPRGVSENTTAGVIEVPAGLGRDGQVLNIPYALVGPVGTTKSATLQISYKNGFDNPPVAGTIVATGNKGAATVAVKIAAHVSDIDDADGLKIDQVRNTDGKIVDVSGGTASIPLAPEPVVWTYRVSDPAGAEAIGTIYVSGAGVDGPYLKPGSVIHVGTGKTFTMKLPDFVLDGAGKKVLLTTRDTFSVAPATNLTLGASTSTSLQITGGSQAGVGSLSFEVTDGPSSTSSAGQHAIITIPVVIGDPAAVLNCPSAPVTVYDQGDSVTVNVAQFCHVWTPDPAQAAGLKYSVSNASPSGLSATGDTGSVTLTAAGVMDHCSPSATESRSGTVTVTTGTAKASQIRVLVKCLPLATFTPPAPFATTSKAGPLQIDLTGNVHSPLASSKRKIVVTQISPIGAAPNSLSMHPGSATLTFNPPDRHGRFLYYVRLNDTGGQSKGRDIAGQIEIDEAAAPGAPTNLQWVANSTNDLLSQAVKLSWRAPTDDGDDPKGIDHYLVSINGGAPSFTCPSSPCQVTGLSNKSQTYSFRVYAVNSVDKSKASSNAVSAMAGKFPGQAVNLHLDKVNDGSIRVAWTAPGCVASGECADITYTITAPGAAKQTTTGLNATVKGPNGTEMTVTVTTGNALTKTLEARGKHFVVGNPATTKGTPAGRPTPPTWLTPAATGTTDAAGSNTKSFTLAWQGTTNPNGPSKPLQYAVTEGSTSPLNGGKIICNWQTGTTCPTSLQNGTGDHYYYVWAQNSGAIEPATVKGTPASFTSGPSAKTTVTAVGTPDPVTSVSARPTGQNGAATLTVTYGSAHGKSGTLICTVVSTGQSCGSVAVSPTAAPGSVATLNATNIPNGNQTLQVAERNEGGGTNQGSDTGSPSSDTADIYGPYAAGAITLQVWNSSGAGIYWTLNVNTNGKPVTINVHDNSTTNPHNTTWNNVNGSWSKTNFWGKGYGYSTTIKITATITDTTDPKGGPTRATEVRTGQATTDPAPPSQTVTVTKGAACGGGGGGACLGGSCGSSSCAYLDVALSGFSGKATCSAYSDGPDGNWTTTYALGNGSHSGSATAGVPPHWWYGYPNTNVWVKCDYGSESATGRLVWY